MTDINLEALERRRVLVFVEDCLEQFDGAPEWSEVAALFNKIQQNREAKDAELMDLFHAADKVYKNSISQEIPLDKAHFKRLPTQSYEKTGENFLVGNLNVAIRRAQGKRPGMEDQDVAAVIPVIGIPYFAVFDGHGGPQCATFLKKEFMGFLQRAFADIDLADIAAIDEAFKTAFMQANASYKGVDGSTGIVALIIDDTIWVANAGDSRAVASVGEKAFQLSLDAKPNHERFRKGVLNRGGEVLGNRVGGALAVARAFGNQYLPGITARPLIKRFPLDSRSGHLLLASDGLFDVVGSREAASLARGKSAAMAADALIEEAFKRGTKDNVTVLVVEL